MESSRGSAAPDGTDWGALQPALDLGWGEVATELARRLSSPWTRTSATDGGAGFAASTDPDAVRCRLAELDGLQARREALVEAGRRGGWLSQALRDVVDIAEPLARVRRGGVLDPFELVDIARVLGAAVVAHELVAGVESVAADDPDATGVRALVAALAGLAPNAALADRLARSLDLDGEEPALADSASPALAKARAHARSAKQELAAAAQRLITRSDMADALADRFWTERQGRVVLPVKAGSLSRGRGGSGVAGIIHGSSTSGQTFFVEPTALIEDNNRLRHAQAAARVEEQRVLASLSTAVREDADALEASMVAMGRLDRIAARLALSESFGGLAPRVSDPSDPDAPPLRLPAARHPGMLIAGAEVVPNDLGIGIGHGLVISGPNAGGKTVALKTMGLCVLMACTGLRLPTSAPADVPLYRRVVTDVGDGQSIAANLSTFTAHLRHVQHALAAAQEDARGTLVLLDEVAVGTEPEQGAALAEAILTRLVGQGATVVATTHYERLKLLATRKDVEGGFTNAAVGFDLAQLRPTFEVRIGLPGSSSALAVARRIGLADAVLEHAQSLMDDTRLAVDVLLAELEAERVALANARHAIEEERAELHRHGARLDARERGEEEGEAKRRARAHKAATARLGELEAEIRQRRRELRQARLSPAPDGQAPAADASARAFAGRAREGIKGQAPARPKPEGKKPDVVAVGDRVFVVSLEAEGDVVSIKGDRIAVQLPRFKTTVKRADLRGRRRPEPEPASRPATKRRAPSRATRHFGHDAQPMNPGHDDAVDLRGHRADEAVTMMEVFLDRAVAEDRDVVMLRHGHGSGALRKVVREALPRLRHVAQHRPGLPAEGGDAVTVVWIRG